MCLFPIMIQKPLWAVQGWHLLGPRSAVEGSLEDSSWEDHVILGGVVVGVDSRGGHAPPAKTSGEVRGGVGGGSRSHDVRLTSRSVSQRWSQRGSTEPQRASVREARKQMRIHLLACTSIATSRQIRDKDQLSGEKPVAWERLCEAAAFSWVRIKRQCAAPVLQMIGRGGEEAGGRVCLCVRVCVLTGFCMGFSSAGPPSPWLRNCSTAWRSGSRGPTPPRTTAGGTSSHSLEFTCTRKPLFEHLISYVNNLYIHFISLLLFDTNVFLHANFPNVW